MNVLALDLASLTGWAITPLHSGVWDIAPRRGDSPGMRYINLRARLELVTRAHMIDLVVYEQAHNRGGAATEYAMGCIAVVQAWCAEHGIQHSAVHTATLKKHALGSGRADKKQMVTAASERWPEVRVIDDNHADALWALDYAQTVLVAGAER